MATSVVFPRTQFFANNGRPLIGGRIHTYAAGSSTRARTYKDAAKAQPNTNPIVLDARGEASVYLAEGVEYKFVVEDSKGALIYTQEPVYGAVWPNAAEWPSDATLSYQYMTEAKAAAETIGPIKFYDTYAQAAGALPGLTNGDIVEVESDEARSSGRTRYRVASGALVFLVNLDQLRQDLAAPAGTGLVGFLQSGTGAVARTLQSKSREVVSVTDFGAPGSSAMNLALAAAEEVHFPAGTHTLDAAPTFGPNGNMLVIDRGASLIGAGVPDGYHVGTSKTMIDQNPGADSFASLHIQRNVDHTGGTIGYVGGAIKGYTKVGAGVANFEWAIIGQVDNYATGGENVGIYGQGIRHGASVGATFGGVFEVLDNTGEANPTKSMVGLEVDCRGNGSDNNFNRVGIDLVVNRQLPAGAPNVVSYGIRIQNGADASAVVKTAFSLNCTAEVGFDTSAATIQQAAIKIAQSQAIAFNALATKQLSYDGVGLKFSSGSGQSVRINDDGGIALNALRFVLNGTWDVGLKTATLANNKPGINSGDNAIWVSINIDGSKYWIPAWEN